MSKRNVVDVTLTALPLSSRPSGPLKEVACKKPPLLEKKSWAFVTQWDAHGAFFTQAHNLLPCFDPEALIIPLCALSLMLSSSSFSSSTSPPVLHSLCTKQVLLRFYTDPCVLYIKQVLFRTFRDTCSLPTKWVLLMFFTASCSYLTKQVVLRILTDRHSLFTERVLSRFFTDPRS